MNMELDMLVEALDNHFGQFQKGLCLCPLP
uniref:Uncharacterized protein n=1 Tax=Picea glauca TaxID=3330 RepID=A0A101M179_PICGL|nr:hypothetical protein ABT39_MTgene3715 [Picea glauca]